MDSFGTTVIIQNIKLLTLSNQESFIAFGINGEQSQMVKKFLVLFI